MEVEIILVRMIDHLHLKMFQPPWQHCVLTWLLVTPAQGLETIDTLMQAGKTWKSFMEVGQGLSYMPPNLNLPCNLRLEYFWPHFIQVNCETQEGLVIS